MAQFTPTWFNNAVIISANALNQIISYRQKSVGDPWITLGFTPANPLPIWASSATSPILPDNKIFEFKVEAICTVGGPTINTNGIQEAIDFACIVPDLDTTNTTATITVDLTGTDITKVNFVLKKTSDNSIAMGATTVNRSGNSATISAPSLLPGTSYYWQTFYYSTILINSVPTQVVSTDAIYIGTTCGNYTTVTGQTQDLIWIPLDTVCEKEGKFNIFKTISGLSSPVRVKSDPTAISPKKMYVFDYDSTAGNIYSFNPDTATSIADMTYYTAYAPDLNVYNGYIDMEKRKIYTVGKNTGGMKVYDIDTDTVSTVSFGVGSNGNNFSRMVLLVNGNNIYCNYKDLSINDIIIIDRTTLTVTNTIPISSIPNNARFTIGGFSLLLVGSEVWVSAGSGSSVSGIGVYNADLSVNITNVTFSGAATWDFSKYWGDAFYDVTSGHVYANDIGSSQRWVIDVATHSILDQKTQVNRQGKTNASHGWTVDPITNELYVTVDSSNSSIDSPIVKTYIEDRSTYEYNQIYSNTAVPELNRIPGTNTIVSAFNGLPSWAGGAWATDGRITFIDSSTTGGNDGNEITLTLQEVDHNNADTPTGNVKDNLMADPDYVPPQVNLTDCPITYTLSCPVSGITTFEAGTLHYEFGVLSSVFNNPAVLKIKIQAYDLDLAATDGVGTTINAPIFSYYGNSFTGLAGTHYTIQVQYLGTSDAVLATCIIS